MQLRQTERFSAIAYGVRTPAAFVVHHRPEYRDRPCDAEPHRYRLDEREYLLRSEPIAVCV